MKKLMLITLSIVHCQLSIDLLAATCDTGWTQVENNDYKLISGTDCGSGWTATTDSSIRPILPGATDDKGTYAEVVCTVQ